jgi:hypothetical protein
MKPDPLDRLSLLAQQVVPPADSPLSEQRAAAIVRAIVAARPGRLPVVTVLGAAAAILAAAFVSDRLSPESADDEMAKAIFTEVLDPLLP